MKLPNAEQAIVDIAKLRDYSLDATHEEGKHKARVFAAALGLDRGAADWLRTMLLAAVLRDPRWSETTAAPRAAPDHRRPAADTGRPTSLPAGR